VAYIYGHKFAKKCFKFQPCGYDDDDDDDDDYDGGGGDGDDPFVIFDNTGGPPYSRVTRSKTHRSYVKLQIISNTTYNVIFL